MPALLENEVEVLPAIDELLLVEDESLSRREMAKLFTVKGFKVREISSAREAVHLAEYGGHVGVVLMDIAMKDDELDGIEGAMRIQRAHPYSCVIFVTAYCKQPEYLRRIQEAGLRVGDMIEKPILRRLDYLVDLVKREMRKVEVRASIARARVEGIWDTSLSQEIVEEVLAESNSRDTILGKEGAMSVDAEITRLYTEIRSLIVRSAREPSLKSAIDPLTERLRMLQEQEAEKMERRFRAQLSVQPETVLDLLARAERLAEG